MANIEHPQQGGAKTNVCCPNCGRTLGDVIESLVRQRGRFKAQRNEARQQLAGAVEALREIAQRPAVERNPDGDDQAAWSMQMIAREALDRFGGSRTVPANRSRRGSAPTSKEPGRAS